MSHAITRTSPKGGPFIGRCIKCGKDGLGVGAPLENCPADGIVSDEQALMEILGRPDEPTVLPHHVGYVAKTPDTRADLTPPAADYVEGLEAACTKTYDTLCEGFCTEVATGYCDKTMIADCGGCQSRAALAARPAPQPAADTRVVTQLKAISLALAKITGRDASDEAALDSLAAEIRSLRSLAGQVETP